MFQKLTILHRIRLLFSKEKESYFALYRILGFFPRKIDYYKEALLHKSSTVRSAKGYKLNNERLEFLGDAILDAIVADIVYRHFEGKREGFLTNTRSKIVQRETLNKLAVEIGLDKLIKSNSHSSNHNSYMCGNAFEALVGAIYLDRGYDACMRFMQERILHRLINIDKVAYKEVNFKSKLIEWSQKNKVAVEFRLVEQTQETGSPVFQSDALLEGFVGGTGTGYSKKEIRRYVQENFDYNLSKPLLLRRPFSKFDITCQGSLPLAIVCFAVIYFLATLSKPVRDGFLVRYIAGFTGICMILSVSKALKKLPVFSYIGRYSIIVLGFHMFLMGPSRYLFSFASPVIQYILSFITITLAMRFAIIPISLKILPYFTAQKDLIPLPSRLRNRDQS